MLTVDARAHYVNVTLILIGNTVWQYHRCLNLSENVKNGFSLAFG
jgi:hypothetical protein